MALTIKNEEAETLCRELAHLSGETITEAVTMAARERLERLRLDGSAAGRAEQILALGRAIAPVLRDESRAFVALDIADLYDENGLPK